MINPINLLRGFCLFMFAARDWRRPLPSLKSCQAANLWRDYHWLSLIIIARPPTSEKITFIIRVHMWQTLIVIFVTKFQHPLIFIFTISLMDTPIQKTFIVKSTFSTATYLSRCHPRATSRWCPCTTVFPEHELPATKESELWLWSQFERVLLEQYCFIKFKSFPHLRIVEKRAYSAPELCVYKLPSTLPLKL